MTLADALPPKPEKARCTIAVRMETEYRDMLDDLLEHYGFSQVDAIRALIIQEHKKVFSS